MGIVILIFGLINAFWYFGFMKKYVDISKKMEAYQMDEEGDDTQRFSLNIDGYRISMKYPEYLGSGGFISIGPEEGAVTYLDEEGEFLGTNGVVIYLTVWPCFISGYEYGVDFIDEAQDLSLFAMITPDLEIVDADQMEEAEVEEVEQLIDDNREEIKKLLEIIEEIKK